MAGDFIKEFLIGLGAAPDKASLSQFFGTVSAATIAVKAMDAVINTVTGTLKGMVNSVPELAAEYRDLAKEAENANVTIAELKREGDIASLMGSSPQAVKGSLEGLSRAAGDTALGIGRAKKVFDSLGLSVTDDAGKLKSSAVLLDDISGKIKGMERGKQKAIVERLGIDPSMLRMMTQDTSELSAQLAGLGENIDYDKAVKDSREIGKSFNWIALVSKKTKDAVVGEFLHPLADAAKWAAGMFRRYMPMVLSVLKPVAQVLASLGNAIFTVFRVYLEGALAVIQWFVNLLKEGWDNVVKLDESLGGILRTIGALILGWQAFNLVMGLSPLGMIILLAAALAELYDDYETWKEGGDSLIDWSSWAPGIEAGLLAIKAVYYGIQDLAAIAGRAASVLVSLFSMDFRGASAQMKDFMKDLPSDIALKSGGGMTPGPAQAAALGGGVNNVSQKTEIHVNGAGDPKAVAAEVGKAQTRVNADLTRNVAAVAR